MTPVTGSDVMPESETSEETITRHNTKESAANMTSCKVDRKNMTQEVKKYDVIKKAKLEFKNTQDIVDKNFLAQNNMSQEPEFLKFTPEQEFENPALPAIAKVSQSSIPNNRGDKDTKVHSDGEDDFKDDFKHLRGQSQDDHAVQESSHIVLTNPAQESSKVDSEGTLMMDGQETKVNPENAETSARTTPEAQAEARAVDNQQLYPPTNVQTIPSLVTTKSEDNLQTKDNHKKGKRKSKSKPKFKLETNRKITEMFPRLSSARTNARSPEDRREIKSKLCPVPKESSKKVNGKTNCTLVNCESSQPTQPMLNQQPNLTGNLQPQLDPLSQTLGDTLDLAQITGLVLDKELGGSLRQQQLKISKHRRV